MGAWRVPTNVSGLISAGARWGSVYKGLGPKPSDRFDLVEMAGWVGRFTTRKVDTYNGWYWPCDVFDSFLVEILL